MVLWAVFWVLARQVLEGERGVDTFIRFGLGVPSVLASLALTYARGYRRYWQLALTGTILFSGVLWATHRALIHTGESGWGYAGLMLVLAFCYIFARVQIVYSAVAGALMIVYYNVVAVFFTRDDWRDVMFADFFLVSFAVVGMAGAYGLERFARLLFLRELQLDRERARADGLLANALPRAIVDRLKQREAAPADASGSGILADGLPEVTVLFADLVGFTRQAGAMSPRGAGAASSTSCSRASTRLPTGTAWRRSRRWATPTWRWPVPRSPGADHAQAAAATALEIMECLRDERWPSGAPLQVRIGIASGPAVAGVIGRRRFAYDLWGDTVNVASRLEATGEPGRILVSEATAQLLQETFELSAPCTVELKGKGPTPARFLLGASGAVSPA